jgi:hypothetical protein
MESRTRVCRFVDKILPARFPENLQPDLHHFSEMVQMKDLTREIQFWPVSPFNTYDSQPSIFWFVVLGCGLRHEVSVLKQ